MKDRFVGLAKVKPKKRKKKKEAAGRLRKESACGVFVASDRVVHRVFPRVCAYATRHPLVPANHPTNSPKNEPE